MTSKEFFEESKRLETSNRPMPDPNKKSRPQGFLVMLVLAALFGLACALHAWQVIPGAWWAF